jgi:hypothetical protein
MCQRVTLSRYPCRSIAFLVLLKLANSSSYSETEMYQNYKITSVLMTIHHLLHTNTKTLS